MRIGRIFNVAPASVDRLLTIVVVGPPYQPAGIQLPDYPEYLLSPMRKGLVLNLEILLDQHRADQRDLRRLALRLHLVLAGRRLDEQAPIL